jgi:hypothetical protein
MYLLTGLLALSVAAGPRVELVVETSKQVYAPGEPVEIAVKLKNAGPANVTAASATAPFYPHATLSERVLSPRGERLETHSTLFEAQWGVPWSVPKYWFVQVPSGQAVEVAKDKILGIWTAGRPELKTDKKPLAPLAPGKYRVEVGYAFERTLQPFGKDKWIERWAKELLAKDPQHSRLASTGVHRFSPGAKALYDKAVEAKLAATVTFEVK